MHGVLNQPGTAYTPFAAGRCEHITVKFQQRDLETTSDWDTLTPGHTAEYAWDEPMATHRLRVVLESATEAFRDAPVQEYNLDDIKVTKLCWNAGTNFHAPVCPCMQAVSFVHLCTCDELDLSHTVPLLRG